MSNPSSRFEKYINASYSGKQIATKLDEYGTWQVYGEDSNPDFGGSHHQPFIGYFEGRLGDIVQYVTEMEPRFWSWGSGGDFKKVDGVKRITPEMAEEVRIKGAERIKKEEEIKKLEEQIESLRKSM